MRLPLFFLLLVTLSFGCGFIRHVFHHKELPKNKTALPTIPLSDEPFTEILLRDLSNNTYWKGIFDTHNLSWRMENPVDWPNNPFAIAALLNGLHALQCSRCEENFIEYENSPQQIKQLDLTFNSQKISLKLSPEGVYNTEQHWYSPLPQSWQFLLTAPLKEFLTPQLWSLKIEQIDKILLESPKTGKKYIFLKKSDHWYCESPKTLKLSTHKTNTFLSSLLKTEVEQFFPEKTQDLSVLGLEMPDYCLTLFSGHTSQSLKIGKSFLQKTNLRFAKFSSYKTIFTIACDGLQELSDPLSTFAEESS